MNHKRFLANKITRSIIGADAMEEMIRSDGFLLDDD